MSPKLGKTQKIPLAKPEEVLARKRKKRNTARPKKLVGPRETVPLKSYIVPLVGVGNLEFKAAAKKGNAVVVAGGKKLTFALDDRGGTFQGIYQTKDNRFFTMRFTNGQRAGEGPGLYLFEVKDGKEFGNVAFGYLGWANAGEHGDLHIEIPVSLRRQGIGLKMIEKCIKQWRYNSRNLKNPETTMFEDITAKFGKKMHVKRFPEIAKKMDPSKKDFLVTEKNNMSEWSSWEAIEPTTGKIRKYRVRLADVATKLRYPNQAKKP